MKSLKMIVIQHKFWIPSCPISQVTAEYANCDPISENINDPVIKSMVKYRSHPSIHKIGEVCNRKQCSLFSFWHVGKEEILKEILSLDSTKVSQDTDIPRKVIKDNAYIFSDFLLSGFNNSIKTFIFPSSLKQALNQFLRKETKIWRKTIEQLAYYQIYQRYLNDSSLNKLLTLWSFSYQNNSVVFVRTTARSIAFYPCLKNGNKRSIKENIFVHFWQTYQKPSIVFFTNSYYQNYIRMVLAWEH